MMASYRLPTIGARIAGKYELYNDSSGRFRFRLKAANGEVIASSESYTTEAAARNGIESVKANARSDTADLT
jgi:uncharacterized protein YegP (UPF0339 family)